MPVEIALIAATAIGKILVPFLSRGVEEVTGQLGEKLSDEAAEHAARTATTLWQRVKAKLSGSDAERVIVQRFEEDPQAAAALLEADLKRKMDEDADFAREIARLVESESPDGSGNVQQIFGDGGILDARGAHISGGLVAANIGTVHGASPVSYPPPKGEPREG